MSLLPLLLALGSFTACGDKDSTDDDTTTDETGGTTDVTTDDTGTPPTDDTGVTTTDDTDTTPPDDTDTGTAPTDDTGTTITEPDSCSGGSGWAPGDWISDIGEDSSEYLATAYIHVPEDLPPCAPLVFYGHGGNSAGGFADGTWDDRLNADLVELDDTLGYVLIVPGVQEGSATSPHSWGSEAIVLDHMTDLVDAAWENADLDRDRTWFIGMSAGCHMAVWLGLYELEPWTDIGAVACGLGGYFDYPETAPKKLMPFYVAHDPEDTVVPYSYSEYLVEKLDEHGHDYIFTTTDAPGATSHAWEDGLTESMIEWFSSN